MKGNLKRKLLNKIDITQPKGAIRKQKEEVQNILRKGLQNGYPIRPFDMDQAGGALENAKTNSLWSNIFYKHG